MNHILQIALDNKQELIGKRVIYNGTKNDRITPGQVYTIENVAVGNHECYLYLEELPERLCFPFTSRGEGPGNVFDSRYFELKE